MSEQATVTIHSIAEDGLPDMDNLTGRVAFIFDGCIVSGWPLFRQFGGYDAEGRIIRYGQDVWEANSDVGHTRPMSGVTHWIEFPGPIWNYERRALDGVEQR